MFDRRDFTALLGAAAIPTTAYAASGTLGFYASAGPKLMQYRVSTRTAALTEAGSTDLPANLQYAWSHPSQKILYVAASNAQPGGGPIGVAGADKNHYALAF